MRKIKTLGLVVVGLTTLMMTSVYAEDETTSQTAAQATQTEASDTTTSPAFEEDILSVVEKEGYELTDYYRPEGAIVVDSETGEIIYGDQIDQPWDPASVSKMMAAYLVFEAIKEGKFSLETLVTASENDRAISAIPDISNNIIVAGVSYPVRDLLTYVLYPSSNVATVMLAHQVAETDGEFVDLMNAKAREWGMTNTHFYNASGAAAIHFRGLYDPEGYDTTATNVTSARDLAILAYHFIKDYPDIINFTKNIYVTAMEGTPYEESFYTLNQSMPGMPYGYPGVDGFKTGSSSTAAWNYLITAKQGNSRYIAVVLGVGSWNDGATSDYYRSQIGNALLNKAFTEYTHQTVLEEGDHTYNGVKFHLDSPITTLVRNGETPKWTLDGDKVVIATNLPLLNSRLETLTYPVTIIPEEKVEETSAQSQEDKQFVAPEGISSLEKFLIELGNKPILLGSIIGAIAVVISGSIVGIVVFLKRR